MPATASSPIPRLITKIYFPREIIPIASVSAVLLDFAVAGVGDVRLDARRTEPRFAGPSSRCQRWFSIALAITIGASLLLLRLERLLPGLLLRAPVHPPGLAVCLAGCLLRRAWFRSNGSCSTASIPWSASSTASAGLSLGGPSRRHRPGRVRHRRGPDGPGRCDGLPACRTQLRGRHLMSDIAIRASGLSKSYRIDHGRAARLPNAARIARIRGSPFHADDRRTDAHETIWALDDVSFEVAARRGARHHRPQRRRQEHPAQDPVADHPADGRHARRSTGDSARCSKSGPASTPS